MINEILAILLAVLIYISIVFVIAWRSKRLDLVDIAWGGGFIVAAITSYTMGDGGNLQILVTTLVTVWGLRLGFYILQRVRNSSHEDPRYTDMRKQWKGSAALNAYTRIFLVQGVLATIVSAAVIMVNLSETSMVTPIAIVGTVVWAIGFVFEVVGDGQLRTHLANPHNKGKLITGGLWRYTRHPNYFGEAVQWWGIWVICLSVPYGFFAIVSPLTITILLLFISGIPLTEKRFEGRPGWKEYKKVTSVFIPLPPREK